MMEVMAARFKVDRQRVAIVGFADTAPQTSNDSDEGRARNRRVDIVIQNNYMAVSSAQKTAGPASVSRQVAK
jgi:flagellar motor protein MotB